MSAPGRVAPIPVAALLALRVAFFPAAPLEGQEVAPSLARVDSLITAGRTEEARDALVAWWDVPGSARSREEAQRGLWLRGLLTVDPAQAAVDYQRLVVEYPGGAWSDRALLRLAQVAEAAGDPLRARTLLRSFLRDYPASTLRLEAGALLERVARSAAVIEATTPAGSGVPGEPGVPDESVIPGARVVPGAPAVPTEGDTRVAGGAAATRSPTAVAPASPAVPSEEARWGVQLGAFASAARARALAGSLAEQRVEARVVLVPGSPLFRVRAGRFGTEAEAERLRRDLLARGREATLSSDVHREEAVP